jgi:DnaA family protein
MLEFRPHFPFAILMRQLILDLLPESPPTLDNFVAGGNAETLALFTEWLAGA